MRLNILFHEGKGIKLPKEVDDALKKKAIELTGVLNAYWTKIVKLQEKGETYHPEVVGEPILFKDQYSGEDKEVYVEITWLPGEDARWINTFPTTVEISIPKRKPKIGYKRYFYNLLVHEITHEVDPGNIKDPMSALSYNLKKGKNVDHKGNWHDYVHDPREVVAWTSEIANRIRNTIKASPEKKNDIVLLLKNGIAPEWLDEKYKSAIKKWRMQPKFWQKKIVPVLWNAIS